MLENVLYFNQRFSPDMLFFSGLVSCLLIVLLAKGFQRINVKADPIASLIFGLVSIASITAIFKSGLGTMLWCNMFLILLVNVKGMRLHLPSIHLGINAHVLFVVLYCFYFVFKAITSVNWIEGELCFANYDSAFYARLVDYLLTTGKENYYMDSVYPEIRGVRLYHYTEHWFAAFVKILSGSGSSLMLFELVVNPILYSLCTVSIASLAPQRKNSLILILLFTLTSLSGFSAIELNTVLQDWVPIEVLRAWGPLNYPKITIAVICLTLLYRAARVGRYSVFLFYSMFLVINYITYLPTIVILITGLGAFKYASNLTEVSGVKKSATIIIAVTVPMAAWFVINPYFQCEATSTPISLLTETIFRHGLSVMLMNALYVVLSFGPVLLLLLIIGLRKVDFVTLLLTLSLVALSIFVSGLMSFNDQSFQLFQNVSIPVLNVFFLLFILYNIGKTPNYRISLVLVLFLSMLAFRETRSDSKVTFDELRKADAFFGSDDDLRTAFIRSDKALTSLHGKHPSLNPPAQWICGMYNTYLPSSINELSWNPSETLYSEKEYQYRCGSPFFLFLEKNGQSSSHKDSMQCLFVLENEIHLLEVERGAQIKGLFPLGFSDSLRLDNGTIIYKM